MTTYNDGFCSLPHLFDTAPHLVRMIIFMNNFIALTQLDPNRFILHIEITTTTTITTNPITTIITSTT